MAKKKGTKVTKKDKNAKGQFPDKSVVPKEIA